MSDSNMLEEVVVVATYDEARHLGATDSSSDPWSWLVLDGRRVVSMAAGPRAVEGLRLVDFVMTPAALEHRDADKMADTLRRSVAKMPRCSSCGRADGSFACRIRHIQLNTGDAKAAKD